MNTTVWSAQNLALAFHTARLASAACGARSRPPLAAPPPLRRGAAPLLTPSRPAQRRVARRQMSAPGAQPGEAGRGTRQVRHWYPTARETDAREQSAQRAPACVIRRPRRPHSPPETATCAAPPAAPRAEPRRRAPSPIRRRPPAQEPSPLWPLPAPRCAGAANERQPPPPQLPPDVQADIAARVLDAAAPGAAAAAAGAGGVATRAAVRLVTRGARDLADGSARRVALPPAQAPGLAAAAPRLRALRELELRFPPGGEGLESAAGGGAALASVADALPLLPPLRSLVVSRAPGAAAAAAASNLESPEDRASEAARVGALEGRFSSLEARLARAEAAAAALVASAGAGASSAAAGAAALVTAAAAAQPGLRALDLRGIDLGAEGSGALADALRAGAWPQLEVRPRLLRELCNSRRAAPAPCGSAWLPRLPARPGALSPQLGSTSPSN